MYFSMGIGKNIREIREKLGLSQNALAEVFRVSARMIRQYEKGEYPINSDALARLIRKYNINPVWLFLDTGKMFLDEELTQVYADVLKSRFNIDDEEITYIIQQAAGSKDVKHAILGFLEINRTLNREDFVKIRKIFDLINC